MYEKKFHTADLKNYRFLITGGAGFIGSNIVEYLVTHEAGKIRVLDNLSTGRKQNIEPFIHLPNFEFIEGDICDYSTCEKACKDIDFVLHQAALGSVPRSIKNPLATHKNNVEGFINILEAARNANIKRFVYASSSSVYGDSPTLPKTEHLLGNPLSPYAVSKRVNELYAQVYSNCYNMDIIGLRYFNVFGPKQSPNDAYAAVIPLFINAMMSHKQAVIFGDGTQSRDFTFVENVIQANILSVFCNNPEAKGKIFNIACGNKITINELYNIISQISGTHLKPAYEKERPGDIKHSLADISLAEKILGYKPLVNVEEGLKITYQWLIKQAVL